MKRLTLIGFLLLAVIAVDAQQTEFPKLSGPYLGQKPPQLTATEKNRSIWPFRLSFLRLKN